MKGLLPTRVFKLGNCSDKCSLVAFTQLTNTSYFSIRRSGFHNRRLKLGVNP